MFPDIPSDSIAKKEVGSNNQDKCNLSWTRNPIKMIESFVKSASEADQKLENLGICNGMEELVDKYSSIQYNKLNNNVIKYFSKIINQGDLKNIDQVINKLNELSIYNITKGDQININIEFYKETSNLRLFQNSNGQQHIGDAIIDKYKDKERILQNIHQADNEELNNIITAFLIYIGADSRYYGETETKNMIRESMENYPKKEKQDLAIALIQGDIISTVRNNGVIYIDKKDNLTVVLGFNDESYKSDKGTIINYTPENQHKIEVKSGKETIYMKPWHIKK